MVSCPAPGRTLDAGGGCVPRWSSRWSTPPTSISLDRRLWRRPLPRGGRSHPRDTPSSRPWRSRRLRRGDHGRGLRQPRILRRRAHRHRRLAASPSRSRRCATAASWPPSSSMSPPARWRPHPARRRRRNSSWSASRMSSVGRPARSGRRTPTARCCAAWRSGTSRAGRRRGSSRPRRALELEGGAGLPGTVWREGQAAWVRDVRTRRGLPPRRQRHAAAGLRGRCRVPDRHLRRGSGRRRVLHHPCRRGRTIRCCGRWPAWARSWAST